MINGDVGDKVGKCYRNIYYLPWALVSLGYTSKTQKSYFICTEKLFHLRLFSSDCTAGPDSGCGIGGGVKLAIQQW